MDRLLARRTPKLDTGAAWRSVSADQTLEAVRPHHGEIGLTRVADVTGLDRIGIPVWQAIRPNGRGLSVAQGKGVSPSLAAASAVMESVESHHAEFVDLPCRIDSYERLVNDAGGDCVADPEALVRSRHSVWHPGLPLPWVRATDVATDAPWWVPLELVHANSTLPRVPGSGCFMCSTNGLASGNTLAEAVLHGLCELVERDANALWTADPRNAESTRVDVGSVVDPGAVDLLGRFDDADIDVVLWDMTSDVGVPAYRAILVDRQAVPGLDPIPAAYGAGCHVHPVVAFQRALTEAAQSRLTAIAGARDDLTRSRYDDFHADDAYAAGRRLVDIEATVDATRHRDAAAATIEEDLTTVVDALRRVGLDRVLVVDLSRPGWPVAVARVVVPGLEGPSASESYRPGRRAIAVARRADAEAR